jgi:flagellar assembly protein FliH
MGTTLPYELAPLEPTAGLAADDPERILARAKEEAELLRSKAEAEGREAGYKAGFEAGEADLKAAVQLLAKAASELRELREQREAELLGEAAELGLLIAEKVVAGALAVEPERIVDVVRGALRQSEERRGIALLLNPEDLPLVSAALATLQSEVGGLEQVELQGERRVERGGVIVRGGEGDLEATVAAQLARAREIVERELAG